jgi:uncharacterized protein
MRKGPSLALRALLSVCLLANSLSTSSAEVIPPAPKQYFNDYANVTSAATAARLNQTLKDFERQTSSQIVVAVYPRMQSDSSVEDYTVRVAQSWHVGQKEKNNGAVLFVFIQDRKMYLQVAYGLEGALPDALAKSIIENEIKPRFRSGDFDGGLTAGVNAILAATRGEYQGTGHTVAESGGRGGKAAPIIAIFGGLAAFIMMFLVTGGFFVFIILLIARRSGLGTVFRGGGGYTSWGSWSSGGSGWSSRGGGGGGGGGSESGFSSGGGSFGGGGAGGSW